jgi:succinoglycan biosynthesis transport protein ExoP
MSARSSAAAYDGDLDVRALGRALWRRKWWVVLPTIVVGIATAFAVTVVTPQYKSEARILYDGRENIFLRPEAEKVAGGGGAVADPETLTSQVQLILSRQLAREVITKLKLAGRNSIRRCSACRRSNTCWCSPACRATR